MASSYKTEQRRTTVREAISTFYGELEDLRYQAQEIVDSAPEGLADSQRIQTFTDTADALSGVVDAQVSFEADLPAELLDQELEVAVSVPRSKSRGPSRVVRCGNAVAYGQAAATKLLDWCDQEMTDLGGEPSEEDARAEAVAEASPGALRLVADMREARAELVDTVREVADKLEEQAGEAEGCEFPGMYG